MPTINIIRATWDRCQSYRYQTKLMKILVIRIDRFCSMPVILQKEVNECMQLLQCNGYTCHMIKERCLENEK